MSTISASNRRVLLALLAALMIYLSVRYRLNPMHVSDPPPDVPIRAAELMDRIDPNTADVATLAALPMIGPDRAADIVAYRERFGAQHDDRPAFATASDLTHVHGIGDATIELLEPYLIFQDEP